MSDEKHMFADEMVKLVAKRDDMAKTLMVAMVMASNTPDPIVKKHLEDAAAALYKQMREEFFLVKHMSDSTCLVFGTKQDRQVLEDIEERTGLVITSLPVDIPSDITEILAMVSMKGMARDLIIHFKGAEVIKSGSSSGNNTQFVIDLIDTQCKELKTVYAEIIKQKKMVDDLIKHGAGIENNVARMRDELYKKLVDIKL